VFRKIANHYKNDRCGMSEHDQITRFKQVIQADTLLIADTHLSSGKPKDMARSGIDGKNTLKISLTPGENRSDPRM
jgi:hypothetical protein